MKIIIALIALVIISTGGWYAYSTGILNQGSKPTQKDLEYQQAYESAIEYERQGQKREDEYNALLKADTYGGATPEETLEMFVEALRKGDAELASKYYLPWEWEKKKEDMNVWIENKAKKFVKVYAFGSIRHDPDYIGGVALEIRESKTDQYPYIVEMELNKINNIWKIKEF